MIEQSAEIVEIGKRSIWIKAPRQTACGSCAAQSSCGQSLMSRFFEGRQHPVEVQVDENRHSELAVGTQVIIGVPESIIQNGSIRIYIMPLIVMLVAAVFGQTLFGESEGVTIISAGVGLMLGFFGVWKHAQNSKNDPELLPVLLDVLGHSCPPVTIPVSNIPVD